MNETAPNRLGHVLFRVNFSSTSGESKQGPNEDVSAMFYAHVERTSNVHPWAITLLAHPAHELWRMGSPAYVAGMNSRNVKHSRRIMEGERGDEYRLEDSDTLDLPGCLSQTPSSETG